MTHVSYELEDQVVLRVPETTKELGADTDDLPAELAADELGDDGALGTAVAMKVLLGVLAAHDLVKLGGGVAAGGLHHAELGFHLTHLRREDVVLRERS